MWPPSHQARWRPHGRTMMMLIAKGRKTACRPSRKKRSIFFRPHHCLIDRLWLFLSFGSLSNRPGPPCSVFLSFCFPTASPFCWMLFLFLPRLILSFISSIPISIPSLLSILSRSSEKERKRGQFEWSDHPAETCIRICHTTKRNTQKEIFFVLCFVSFLSLVFCFLPSKVSPHSLIPWNNTS